MNVTYYYIYTEMCKKYFLDKEQKGVENSSDDEFDEDAEEEDYDSNAEDNSKTEAESKAESKAEFKAESKDESKPKTKKKLKYNIKDFRFVCLRVFQQEILKVCGLPDDTHLSKMSMILDEVWHNIFTVPGVDERFKLLILKYQDAYFKEGNYDKKQYQLYFGILFDFTMFNSMHRCLHELFGPEGKISSNVLDDFEMEINIMIRNKGL